MTMWSYKTNGCEIVSIEWLEWAEIYQAAIRTKADLDYEKESSIYLKIYDKDLEILKLKSLLEAKELGWDIKVESLLEIL